MERFLQALVETVSISRQHHYLRSRRLLIDYWINVVLKSLLNGLLHELAETFVSSFNICSRLSFIFFHNLSLDQHQSFHDMNSCVASYFHAEHRQPFLWVFLFHRTWLYFLSVVVDLFRAESIAESILEAFSTNEDYYLARTQEVDLVVSSIASLCRLKGHRVFYQMVQIHRNILPVWQRFEFFAVYLTVPISPMVRQWVAFFWIQLVNLIVTSRAELFEMWLRVGRRTFTFILDLVVLTNHVEHMFECHSFPSFVYEVPVEIVLLPNLSLHLGRSLSFQLLEIFIILILEASFQEILSHKWRDIDLVVIIILIVSNDHAWSWWQKVGALHVLLDYRIIRLTVWFYDCIIRLVCEVILAHCFFIVENSAALCLLLLSFIFWWCIFLLWRCYSIWKVYLKRAFRWFSVHNLLLVGFLTWHCFVSL